MSELIERARQDAEELKKEARSYSKKWDNLLHGELPAENEEGIFEGQDNWPPDIILAVLKRLADREKHTVHYLFPQLKPDAMLTLRNLAAARSKLRTGIRAKAPEAELAKPREEFERLAAVVRGWDLVGHLLPAQCIILGDYAQSP